MRIIQIITILLSGALLVLAGGLAVAPPEPRLAEQAQFEEVAAPAEPVAPEPTTPALVGPPKPTEPDAPAPKPEPAATPNAQGFIISDMRIKPEGELFEHETVYVTVTVKNAREQTGTYKLEFKVNGQVKTTTNITLAGGASQNVSFDFFTESTGKWLVEVDSLKRAIDANPAP